MAAGKKESDRLLSMINNKDRTQSSHEITHFLVDLEDTHFV